VTATNYTKKMYIQTKGNKQEMSRLKAYKIRCGRAIFEKSGTKEKGKRDQWKMVGRVMSLIQGVSGNEKKVEEKETRGKHTWLGREGETDFQVTEYGNARELAHGPEPNRC